MELVYLWVEEYKNIKRQGFNFSPNFKCEFKPVYKDGELTEESELIINKKDNPLKNFFGQNINVTAIVGENGSGKSSILELITKLIDNDGAMLNRILLVYFYNGKFYYISNIEEVKTYIKNENHIKNKICIYNIAEHMHYAYRSYQTVSIDQKSIINILVGNYSKSLNYEISTFMYIPKRITIKYKDEEELLEFFINHAKPLDRDKIKRIYRDKTDPFEKFLMILCIQRNGIYYETLNIFDNKDSMLRHLKEEGKECHDIFIKFIDLNVEKTFDFSEENREKIKKFINEEYFHFFEYDLVDEVNRNYNDLSNGEKVILGILLNIYFYTKNNSKILLLDEPELSLHPDWQKRFLNENINLLKKYDFNYHLFFTSHSPFLLSDLPKENVIFLEKDKETGNCINATDKTNINPFGANIHTLLSHGFFMRNGLIGEFAKNKIDEVVELLNSNELDKEKIEYCESIISIIGEPLIKRQLQKMLDSKRLKKVDRIDDIERQIYKLSQELESLKND